MRSALIVVLAALATPVSLGAGTPSGDGVLPDWPQWRGPDRSGITPDTGWASSGRAEPLWSADVGLGYSNVCLSRGRLVTHGFVEKDAQDVVVCLDPLTGAEHWRYAYPARKWDTMHAGGTLTTPVADGDRIYVMSRMGALHCLRVDDGAVLWTRALDADLEVSLGSFGIPVSPLVLPEGLVLNVGKTVLLDKATGKTTWETKDYGYSYSVPIDAEIGGRRLLVVFNAAGLVTLDRETGAERSVFPWTSQYNVNCATPVVIGSRVFISTGFDDKGCAMLELASGEPKIVWQSKVMRSKMTGCVLFGDHLYGFDKALLKCLDLDGDVKWRERGLGNGALLVSADGRLITLAEDGELVIAKATPAGFAEETRTRVFDAGDGRCWTTPVLSGGLLFCRSSTGRLVCRDHRPVTP